MKTEISTTRYARSHGKQPKGKGRWVFEDRSQNVIFSFNGVYAEAKKAAINFGRNHETMYVAA
jgi:hypothetical protein